MNKNKKEILIGIYCIENLINNKKYIGQSVNIERRWREHGGYLRRQDDTPLLQNAWNKYGKNNFKFYVIELCDTNLLDEKEIFYIKEWKSHKSLDGYNLCWGGEGGALRGVFGEDHPMFGTHRTEEEKQRMRKPRSEEAKKNMRGLIRSEEHRKNQSIAMKGKPSKRKGIPISEETKRKTSESQWGSKGNRAKLTDDNVINIKKLLKEGFIKISVIAKIYNVDPKTIRKIRDGIIWRNIP